MDKRVLIGAAAVGVVGYLVWSMRSSAQQQVNTTAANTSGSASALLSGLMSGWANPSSVIPSASTVAASGTVATPAPAPSPTTWRPSSMEDNTPEPAPAPAPAAAPAQRTAYDAAIANPASIPRLAGETQEQALARVQGWAAGQRARIAGSNDLRTAHNATATADNQMPLRKFP